MIALALLLFASPMVASSTPVPGTCPAQTARAQMSMREDGQGGAPGKAPLPLLLSPVFERSAGYELAIDDEVAAAAHAALADVWADSEVRVVRLSPGAEDAMPPLRVRFHDDAPRGRASAEIETRVASPTGDSTWVAAGWAYLDVAVFDTAFVLTRDVARGDELARAAVPQRADVTALADPLTALTEGLSAARSLRAGTVLTARHADAPSVVDARAPLRVRYTRGALTVTLACRARERGALGESIRASCPDTRAVYRVRLTGPGEGVWTATLSS